MPTSGGNTTKHAAHPARTYIAVTMLIMLVASPATAFGTKDGPVRSAVCDIRALAGPLLGSCRSSEPEPGPEPSAEPRASSQPDERPGERPSANAPPRAAASGTTGAIPPLRIEDPAPAGHGGATADAGESPSGLPAGAPAGSPDGDSPASAV
ncbi:MAG TPA: hypothetical protein VM841_06405, partial [Actinomycetota bacterium]|nr:hypothetical protein [Actinomycetota bacterium]